MNEKELRRIIAASGLTSRNWSHCGRTILAVYGPGDCYLGTVRIDGSKLALGRWDMADLRKHAKTPLIRAALEMG